MCCALCNSINNNNLHVYQIRRASESKCTSPMVCNGTPKSPRSPFLKPCLLKITSESNPFLLYIQSNSFLIYLYLLIDVSKQSESDFLYLLLNRCLSYIYFPNHIITYDSTQSCMTTTYLANHSYIDNHHPFDLSILKCPQNFELQNKKGLTNII